MSLINKMLQDLDARGGNGARAGASPAVRPVSYGGGAGWSPAMIGAGVVALAVLGGGGFAAWKYFRGGRPPVSPPAASPALQSSRVAQPAALAGGPAPVAADDRLGGGTGEKLASRMEERNAEARRAAGLSAADAAAAAGRGEQGALHDAPRKTARSGDSARSGDTQRSGGAERKAASAGHVALGGDERPARHAKRAREIEGKPVGAMAAGLAAAPGAPSAPSLAAAKRKASAGATPGAAGQGEGVEAGLSSQQKAENEYRRALQKLQDARVSEAIAGLEQAVYLYPRHDAARQTLVSLLVEAGRTQEAIRHLTFATSLDPRQANMAMLLARLQLENGGNALDTLQRSLPYAESNADYRALMAGILQRANRHREAAEHYQAAVRLQPTNAVWWMGLGISLQADKRNAEAKVAFQRARDSGRLAPELQTFVERRLQQLN